MNALASPWFVERLGWTLFHSLWQISLLAAVYVVLHRMLIRRSANGRYLLGCLTLAAMAVLPAVTMFCLAIERAAPIRTLSTMEPSDDRALNGLAEQHADQPDSLSATVADRSPPRGERPAETSRSRGDARVVAAAQPAMFLESRNSLTGAIEPWLPTMVRIWLVGVLLLSLRPVIGLMIVYRLRHVAVSPVAKSLVRTLRKLADRMGIRRPVAALHSALVDVPATIGTLRPLILLPASTLCGLTPSQLESILAHELAHIRRHDYLMAAMQTVLETILFYHPLAWWVSRQVRIERENCCDDVAVDACGSRANYAEALLILDQLRTAPPRAALAANGGMLLNRIRRLAGHPPRSSSTGNLIALASGLVLFAAMILPVALSGPANSVQAAASQDNNALAEDFDELPVLKNELAGVVVDPQGQPVEGVLVDVWTWYKGNETRTDKQGRFRLKGIQDQETVQVRFSKDGYSPHMIVRQPLGQRFQVRLGNRTYFEGRVVDGNGQPVAEARIRANQGPKDAEGVLISEIWTETSSDAQGNYRLYVQADTYDIQVAVPQVGVARLVGQQVAEDQSKDLDIALKPGVTFRAKIVDSLTGQPVEGVCLWDYHHPGVEGISNIEGLVTIEGMLPGRFSFQVTGREMLSYFKTKTPITRRNHRYDANGFARWWSEQCVHAHQRFQVRENGWQRNFDSLDFDLEVGMQPVTITVERAVVIRGRVIDPDGLPVGGATVAPAMTGTGNSITGDTRYSFVTKDDGTYEMMLPASKDTQYNLIAHDGGYKQWRNWANGVSEPVQTTPGEVLENVVLQLNRPATVRGVLKDTDGNPVANHRVRAVGHDLASNRYYVPEATTDAAGQFELAFVRPGRNYIQAMFYWRNFNGPRVGPAYSGTPAEGPADSMQLIDVRPGDRNEPVELTIDLMVLPVDR